MGPRSQSGRCTNTTHDSASRSAAQVPGQSQSQRRPLARPRAWLWTVGSWDLGGAMRTQASPRFTPPLNLHHPVSPLLTPRHLSSPRPTATHPASHNPPILPRLTPHLTPPSCPASPRSAICATSASPKYAWTHMEFQSAARRSSRPGFCSTAGAAEQAQNERVSQVAEPGRCRGRRSFAAGGRQTDSRGSLMPARRCISCMAPPHPARAPAQCRCALRWPAAIASALSLTSLFPSFPLPPAL